MIIKILIVNDDLILLQFIQYHNRTYNVEACIMQDRIAFHNDTSVYFWENFWYNERFLPISIL
jgi:hypothetical protein